MMVLLPVLACGQGPDVPPAEVAEAALPVGIRITGTGRRGDFLPGDDRVRALIERDTHTLVVVAQLYDVDVDEVAVQSATLDVDGVPVAALTEPRDVSVQERHIAWRTGRLWVEVPATEPAGGWCSVFDVPGTLRLEIAVGGTHAADEVEVDVVSPCVP